MTGSASGHDATTTGGSMDGLAPNTSCISSKNCHVAAVISPASVPDPVLGVLRSCNKQKECYNSIINIHFIIAALTESLLKITVMHLLKLELQCFPLTLYFRTYKFSHFLEACWEVIFPSRPSSLTNVLYHNKHEEYVNVKAMKSKIKNQT